MFDRSQASMKLVASSFSEEECDKECSTDNVTEASGISERLGVPLALLRWTPAVKMDTARDDSSDRLTQWFFVFVLTADSIWKVRRPRVINSEAKSCPKQWQNSTAAQHND